MTEVRPTTPLSPAAERMRRSRELRRKGSRIVQFVVRDIEVDALVSRGLLDPADRENRAAISWASRRFGSAFQTHSALAIMTAIQLYVAAKRRRA